MGRLLLVVCNSCSSVAGSIVLVTSSSAVAIGDVDAALAPVGAVVEDSVEDSVDVPSAAMYGYTLNF